ncbi:MAG: hypothetical protein ACT4QD_13615 [Acidobacteriota bacterium]
MSRLPVILIAVLWSAGCGPSGPLRLDAIQLGRSLNPDNTVSGHTTTFGPFDTIYVAVLTSDEGKGTISVKWVYAGRTVSEPSQAVAYRGAAATEFHIQNSGGFPEGSYSVEVFLDGATVGTRDFRVEKEK